MRQADRILVIDDELQIRRFLRISLKSQGYEVFEAENATVGLELAATSSPDIIVLDLGLPDADGNTVLKELRTWSTVPVIILSVRASESEKVQLLDDGANDYVTKPFGIQEFLARVRNLLRQSTKAEDETGSIYDDGYLHVDLLKRKITISDAEVHLTRKEFSILRTLIMHPGQVITQTQLLKNIWGPSHTHDTQYLRNFIKNIRQKLHDNSDEPRYVQTESGVGYRFIDNRQTKP
ncbi:two-component system KDP operon response regulator KdpE [Methylohalomonas lacus]|uniref:Two-component system KDP operon response regulator KdpE n=1 Tax=Methylohalomonas lacus TaxID=398773 RepID=A0AAE3HLN6_9GAMM|nr:response regulator [Methylohalomonas lacus]MCS3904626.1 two-component system KDP operon response regulator KdpE [Methylohalomonas lacus]